MVFASEAKQSRILKILHFMGLRRRYAPRNDQYLDFLRTHFCQLLSSSRPGIHAFMDLVPFRGDDQKINNKARSRWNNGKTPWQKA